MAQDLSHLGSIGDDGKDAHGRAAAGAAQGAPAGWRLLPPSEVNLVHFRDQTGPSGTGLLCGDGQLLRFLLEGNSGLGLGLRAVLLLPALGGEAEEVGLACPCTTGSGGV